MLRMAESQGSLPKHHPVRPAAAEKGRLGPANRRDHIVAASWRTRLVLDGNELAAPVQEVKLSQIQVTMTEDRDSLSVH